MRCPLQLVKTTPSWRLSSCISCPLKREVTMWEVSSYVRYHCREEYPYSHNHLQILSTDLHTFSLRVSWETLLEDQSISPLVIIFSILITFALDDVWKMLEENWCKDKAIPPTESEGKWVIKTSLTHVFSSRNQLILLEWKYKQSLHPFISLT